MARAVFLHVGAPKSGTTFLQSVLWANKDGLRQEGLLLPGEDQFDAFYATMSVREVRRTKGLPARASDAWDRLVDEVAAWSGTAVISHEFFAAASAEQAARARAALAPADVHVVMTARDYVSQLPALWQESVKVGSQSTFDSFVDEMLSGSRRGPLGWDGMDIVSVLDRWGSGLPAEHVHVVTVPPTGSPPDLLWTRLCEVLGLSDDGWTIPQTRRNESLGAVQVELLRRVNPHLKAPLGRAGAPHYKWIRRFLAEDVLVSHRGRRFGLSAASAQVVRTMSDRAVTTIGDRGWNVVGDLADLTSQPVDSDRTDPADVSTQELLDEAVRTIADLMDRQRRADRALRRSAEKQLADAAAPSLRRLLRRR